MKHFSPVYLYDFHVKTLLIISPVKSPRIFTSLYLPYLPRFLFLLFFFLHSLMTVMNFFTHINARFAAVFVPESFWRSFFPKALDHITSLVVDCLWYSSRLTYIFFFCNFTFTFSHLIGWRICFLFPTWSDSYLLANTWAALKIWWKSLTTSLK